MNFSRFLDIQSWWEIPSIAYFCSLFRTAFNLLDFDIEELEEALLTDGTEESTSYLLTELIVRLLNGCLGNSDISAINYQMYLRRLFRRKCQETGRYNPFDSDIDFQFLPLRTKVEILYELCDFRLDAEDVCDLFKNLEAESLRVEPLGWDDNNSAYWYFYGTRLYREDNIKKSKTKSKKKKGKESKKRGWLCGEDWLDNDETERVWQVVCFTEEDWTQLTKKFSKATSKVEKELYHSLSKNFLPEIPRLFQEKERLQRKRLLELAPRRTSNRVLEKIKQKEKTTESSQVTEVDEKIKVESNIARKCRANRRNDLRSQSVPSDTSESTTNVKEDMSQILLKRSESQDKLSKVEMQTEHPQLKTGRKTNNSLASVTGQIVIPDSEPVNSNRKRLKTSQIFSQTEEDIQTDMYKVLDQLTIHEDAWPFMDPVEEEYAPNYYAVIRRPMDLRKMEERLDSGYYTDFAMFEADFKLIVNNCRLYNGQDNEYTVMVDNLQGAFDRLTEKYIRGLTSSDDEIAVEYQLPSPSKKHKLKCSESVNRHKRMKRKSRSHTDGRNYTSSEKISHKSKNNQTSDAETKKNKESHKIKDKKKRKGHHRRRHSKSYKNSYALSFERHESFKAKYNKKQIRTKNKSDKKSKQKQKKIKSHVPEPDIIKRSLSPQSLESSNGSRSASPLPSILTPTPSPTELDQTDQTDQHTDLDNIKYKFGKVKEKTNVPKKIWESLLVYKEKNIDKQKQNLRIPETNKNQKLRETIEKLRTKNEKYKDSPLFDSLFSSSRTSSDINMDTKNTEEPLNYVSLDNDDEFKQKEKPGKMFLKKNTTKNESASEALKQAVKDISKWLDDAPNSSAESSSCDSLAQTIPTEENSNSRIADVFAYGEKSFYGKKELSRKQTSSRDPKFVKRREIQRTIDRLQPGKSKGNLLTNMTNKNAEKEEDTPVKSLVKASDSSKGNGLSPKLSLGSVLPTVEFTLGNDHSFNNTEDTCEDQKEASKGVVDSKVVAQEQTTVDENIEELYVQSDKKDAEIETQPQTTNKPSQEKATPNLSAWFKAFGAPKSTNLTPAVKKKDNEIDEKLTDNDKSTSPINTPKFDSLLNTDNANPDSLESPLLNASATPRQRRTSTGSSVSEKSSYSQDLDSPRHQLSHTSPLLRSPASPKVDDFQKITYPIINGTIRAGFYQDTTSIKSSPDKSYSPREGIQSPYSPYSQHVYASNNAMGSSSNTYFNNQNNSPRPTYVQHMPPYYESSKVPTSNKQERVNEDYATFGLGSYEQDEYCNPISPAQPSYLHLKSANYPETKTLQIASDSTPALQSVSNPKDTFFPVKKRTYNEHGLSSVATRKSSGTKDIEEPQDITDCPNFSQSLQAMSLSNPSVDNIARTLSAKSERDKVMSLREKSDSIDHRHELENRAAFENNTPVHESKKDFLSIDFNAQQKDNVDMVNMGYMNPDNERKNSNETNSSDMIFARDMKKQNNTRPKCYEVEAINLDLSNQQFQKPIDKSNINLSNISPAQVHEKSLSKCINQNIANANHMQSNDQSISRFSLNDIELANKKLFACNATPTATALNYDNWKMTNENRKQALVCNVSNAYDSNDAEKLKAAVHSANIAAANYNKNIQHEYNNYAVNKIQRAQELHQNISSELRIPNPRGLFKNDHANIATSTSDTNFIARSIDTVAKPRKTEKLPHNHPHVNPIQHKTSYSAHSLLPLERLRNLPNIPEMLQRYTNDERYISNVAGSTSTLYNDKTFDITQILSNGMPSDINHTNTSVIYSQPSMSKDNKTAETRTKASKRKKAETKQTQMPGTQGYHTSSCGSDVLSCVKSNMVPGTTFNFNTSTSMGLGGALFGDNGGFSVEDFRHSNQIMAAKYMAATVAHQQRSNVDIKTEKVAKPAHQNSSYTSGSFPFLGQSQVRSGYPFADPASPIYQQYFQRQELLRQTGAQIMGFYQPSYPPSLGVRQPYDSINRPSWL